MYTDASQSPEAHGFREFLFWCCTLCGFGQRNGDMYLPIAVSKSGLTILNIPCAPPSHPTPPPRHNCWQAAAERMSTCICVHVEARGPSSLLLFRCCSTFFFGGGAGSLLCLEPANPSGGVGRGARGTCLIRFPVPIKRHRIQILLREFGDSVRRPSCLCKAASTFPTELSPEPTTEVFLSLYHSSLLF